MEGTRTPPDPWRLRRWKRTRLGLLLSAIGFLLAWIPLVAAIGALPIAFGSTFLFTGARAVGRRHENAVLIAYLALTVGGVAVGGLVGAFLLQAYHASKSGLALSTLSEPVALMIWGTLPGTVVIGGGFGLQALHLVPRRHRRTLVLTVATLAATAAAATVLSAHEATALPDARVTVASMLDLLTRLSLYRMVEAPSYLLLAILYFVAYWDAGIETAGPAPGSPRGAQS